MASPTTVENLHSNSISTRASRPATDFQHNWTGCQVSPKENVPPDQPGLAEATTPEVIAHSVEFVAWPGKAEQLRTVMPEAMRSAFAGCPNFSGCMVFFPEQEARLVTVITLWKGEGRANQCEQNSKRVEQMLFPYIEHWLRARKLTALLCLR